MRAAVLREYGEPLEIETVERPDPDPDGVVIETEACGICRSDWHAWQGDWDWIGAKPPRGQILGHEPAGTVVAVGEDVTRLSEGDSVAVPFNLSDGTCPTCRNGHANVCENVVPLGLAEAAPGAFAEEVHVPVADQNAVRLPDAVSPVAMAGLGCRFVTAFHALVHRADVTAGDWVAVHGCGGVGLSAVHVADAVGANVVAVDLADEKLSKAEELGAVETVNASETENVPRAIAGITDGGAHVSVDALGIAETCRNSVSCLRRRGQHVQIGLTTQDERGSVTLPTDAMVMKEIDFLGSFGMQPPRYDEIFRMVETGSLDPSAVVSETVTLDDVPDRLAAMSDYETMGIPVVDEF
ncbi:zinc-dependent alcohol dehydrogenase family protein [Halorussus gelatinilyticus]|uniref:Zinc-dependent alcohol dehydrogenase family protein n=1 Tax=Halorussus gelatinilyticus TaxID=2937524 RepID=A0A8U0IFS8_9EURY|nr:zinc-dependent alcohol dehydrogenase family protein [Halorussus gelatinilyticus]UPV98908.1 zinc-dependent alcohol dehydrogenase family protein [Halorussus gelatinilyticus]